MTLYKDETPSGQGKGFQGTQQNLHREFTPDQERRLTTLKVLFALRGHRVIVTDGNDFLVTRWGMARYCKNFAALELFARQVGAAS